MSAIEWLHFINTLIVITIAVVLMVSIPVTKSWRAEFSLSDKPFAMKKILLWGLCFISIGWFFAWTATHISTPIIRVNIVALSQLILTLSLMTTGIVTIRRLFQKNSFITILFILIKRHVVPALPFLGAAILYLFATAVESMGKVEAEQEREDAPLNDVEKGALSHYMNLDGEYCDETKSNWY